MVYVSRAADGRVVVSVADSVSRPKTEEEYTRGRRKTPAVHALKREPDDQVHCLQRKSEAAEEDAGQGHNAESVFKLHGRRSSDTSTFRRGRGALLSRAVITSSRGAGEATAGGGLAGVSGGSSVGGGARGAGGLGAAAGGGVGLDGVLCTARVVLSAVGGALVVAGTAVVDTLVAPLLADEEGECLGVLGDVGVETVGAFAVIGEVVGVAAVGVCGGGLGGRLQADELWKGLVSVRCRCWFRKQEDLQGTE